MENVFGIFQRIRILQIRFLSHHFHKQSVLKGGIGQAFVWAQKVRKSPIQKMI